MINRPVATTPHKARVSANIRQLARHVNETFPEMKLEGHLHDAARELDAGRTHSAQRHLNAAIFGLQPQQVRRHGIHDDGGHEQAKQLMQQTYRHLLNVKDIEDMSTGNEELTQRRRDAVAQQQAARGLPPQAGGQAQLAITRQFASGPEPYRRGPDETVQCPACGKYDAPDARYCDQCGRELPASAFADLSTVTGAIGLATFAGKPPGSGANFKKLSGTLAKRGVRNPGALAAYIGRKKYGRKRFGRMGHGHSHASPAGGVELAFSSAEPRNKYGQWMAVAGHIREYQVASAKGNRAGALSALRSAESAATGPMAESLHRAVQAHASGDTYTAGLHVRKAESMMGGAPPKRVALANPVELVGPKGYIHGWIKASAGMLARSGGGAYLPDHPGFGQMTRTEHRRAAAGHLAMMKKAPAGSKKAQLHHKFAKLHAAASLGKTVQRSGYAIARSRGGTNAFTSETTGIELVGPKGYVHGWRYVGGPGLPDHPPGQGRFPHAGTPSRPPSGPQPMKGARGNWATGDEMSRYHGKIMTGQTYSGTVTGRYDHHRKTITNIHTGQIHPVSALDAGAHEAGFKGDVATSHLPADIKAGLMAYDRAYRTGGVYRNIARSMGGSFTEMSWPGIETAIELAYNPLEKRGPGGRWTAEGAADEIVTSIFGRSQAEQETAAKAARALRAGQLGEARRHLVTLKGATDSKISSMAKGKKDWSYGKAAYRHTLSAYTDSADMLQRHIDAIGEGHPDYAKIASMEKEDYGHTFRNPDAVRREVAAANQAGGVELSARTAMLERTPAPYGKPGGPGLYGVAGNKHSDYFEQVVKALMTKRGMDKEQASRIAWGALRKWRRGGGHVHPEVSAAAGRALGQEAAAGARARGHANEQTQGYELVGTAAGAAQDPRTPLGTFGTGGGAAPKGGKARQRQQLMSKIKLEKQRIAQLQQLIRQLEASQHASARHRAQATKAGATGKARSNTPAKRQVPSKTAPAKGAPPAKAGALVRPGVKKLTRAQQITAARNQIVKLVTEIRTQQRQLARL